MYRFILKYRQVIFNAAIFIFLLLASMDFHKDFFHGAALGAVLMALGESIGNLKRKRNKNELNEINISVINE